MLVRSMTLILVGAVAAALVWVRGWRAGGIGALVFVVGLAAAVAPWTVRNWQTFGRREVVRGLPLRTGEPRRHGARRDPFYAAAVAFAFAGALVVPPRTLVASAGLAFWSLFYLGAVAALVLLPGPDRYHFPVMPFVVAMGASFWGRAVAERRSAVGPAPPPS